LPTLRAFPSHDRRLILQLRKYREFLACRQCVA
jgi:hypothetical protein